VLAAMKKANKRWGDKKCGGLVACAGVGGAGAIVKADGTPYPLDAYEQVIRVNLLGTINCARLVASQIVQCASQS
jgi:NAD(P)-dependent dehydrogenase (short-subunit alcohol dehydrogenase family)